MSKDYDDMLTLPYPFELIRPRMSTEDRAAQFSAFAALVGHDAAIAESGRLTQQRAELTEDRIAALNETLCLLSARLPEGPRAAVTYFVPDLRKEGGAYVRITGRVRRIDRSMGVLWLEDEAVDMAEIYEIQLL